MKPALLIALALLAGCAGPHVETANPRSVVVRSGRAAEAQDLAQVECAKHGRHARLSGEVEHRRWFFDCVL